MEKLVLIDGNSLINRAFYAMPLLSTKDGIYTNAVYGFLNMFFKMITDNKPKYVAVAFDLKAPTFRHKMYTEYKGTRKPMPEELRPQIPLLKELLSLMNVAVFEKEGYEADDIIGTIAKATSIDTYIYTGDRDSFQLVDGETSVCFTKRGITDLDILTNSNFKEKTGLNPYQIIELKALMGDSSDNIPGVPGVGEKTAYSLLEKYETVENLYNNVEELSGKLKEKIESGKDSCFLSKELATIDVNVPIDTNVENMELKLPFSTEVRNKFATLELKSLALRNEFFEKASEDVKTDSNKIKIIEIKEKDEIKNIKANEEIAFTFEDDNYCIFDSSTDTEYKLFLRKTLEEGLDFGAIISVIKDVFSSKKKVIVFSKKDTVHFLLDNGITEINADFIDLSLMKYLVDFSGRAEDIKGLIGAYNLTDDISAYGLYEAYKILDKKIIEEEVEKLYGEVELPLSNVLLSMENEGFKIDVDALTEIGKKYESVISDLELKIKELTGEDNLNINSPKQLGEVLFEKLKIGKGKKTKKGYSTSAEVLENFEDAHPVVPLILRYRQIQKLYSTYVEGFKPLIDRKTGLIHTSFNQTATATGRLSSSEPNLQNIPVRDDEGKELRRFFVSKFENGILVSADYSQIELRLLASFSCCESLIEAFKNGVDVHTATASRIFNVPIEKVDSTMRRKAKAVNFGVIYGISEYGLSKNLKISAKEAREYIDSYFEQYPEVRKYMDENVAFARQHGYSVTMLKRRRYIREINASNFMLRQFGERVAMNMPLQGSAADVIKLAMINVYNRLNRENLRSKLILQIHDELIIDTVLEEKERVKQILKDEMGNAVDLSVKLTVEMGEGKTWFDAK